MSVSFSQTAVVAAPGAQYTLASLISISAGSLPEYLVLTGLDRERYTVTSNSDRGTLTGNGNTAHFATTGSDCYNFGIVFTYTGQGYVNASYGNLAELRFTASTDNNRSENLSLYGFGTAGTENAARYASLLAALADPYFAGLGFTYASSGTALGLGYATSNYLGTLDIVTRRGYVDASPGQATPDEIAAVAASYVGQAWNADGCWVLACDIAAAAGASLPLTSTKALVNETPPVGNGEWFVAYSSAEVAVDRQKYWISELRAGDVVVANNTCGGHVATVVSGSGYAARLIDNYGSSANDGSADDVIIRPAHDLLNLVIPADARNIAIYRLDAPLLSIERNLCLAAGATAAVAPLFSASDPAGRAITAYQFYAASGELVVDGQPYSAHSAATAATVAAASLGGTRFHAGGAGADTLWVRAYNGAYWGDWRSIAVDAGSTLQAPMLHAVSEQVMLHGGDSVALSSLITAVSSDAPITSYTIRASGSSGNVQLNGASNLAGGSIVGDTATYVVSAADFAKLSFVGGSNIGGEMLSISADNGAAVPSNSVSLAMATVGASVHGIFHWLQTGADIPLSALFSVTRFDERPILSYTINTDVTIISWGANTPSSGGSLLLNGVTLLPSYLPHQYTIAAADLSRVSFRAAPDNGAQFLEIWANDGAWGVGATTLINTVAERAPLIAVAGALAGQTMLPVSSLFALNAGAAPVYYRFTDPAGAGSLELDPGATNRQAKSDPTPGVFVVSAAELDKLDYLSGSAGASESLLVSTSSDQFHWTAEVALPVASMGRGTTICAGARRDYALTHNADGSYTVSTAAGAAHTVAASQEVRFSDMTVSLGIQAAAATIPGQQLDTLVQLYAAFFHRVPEAQGLSGWIEYLRVGHSLDEICDQFYAAGVQYASLTGYSDAMSNADFVKVIYANALGRTASSNPPPDADVQWWAGRIAEGKETRGSLVRDILAAAHTYKGDATWGWAADLLDNKLAVGKIFAVDDGLSYNSAADSITHGMAIAAAVTPSSTAAALQLIGISDGSLAIAH